MTTDFTYDDLGSYDIPSYEDDYCFEEENDIEEDIEFYVAKIGPAPLDYHIVAQTIVMRPPMVKPVYILCWCHPESLAYYVSDYPVLRNGELLPQEERQFPREEYEAIEDAGKSDFFKSLFRIDKAVDKKLEELKRNELDTKYAPHGLRIGASWQEHLTCSEKHTIDCSQSIMNMFRFLVRMENIHILHHILVTHDSMSWVISITSTLIILQNRNTLFESIILKTSICSLL